jgi:hypothetical protein
MPGRVVCFHLDAEPLALRTYPKTVPRLRNGLGCAGFSDRFLVLRPSKNGQMGKLLLWITATHSLRYHSHHPIRGKRMLINLVSRVFLFKTIRISMYCVDMSREIQCERTWLSVRKTGNTDRFIDGTSQPSHRRRLSRAG